MTSFNVTSSDNPLGAIRKQVAILLMHQSEKLGFVVGFACLHTGLILPSDEGSAVVRTSQCYFIYLDLIVAKISV